MEVSLDMMCQKAYKCRLVIGKLDADEKNKVLLDAADLLLENAENITCSAVLLMH